MPLITADMLKLHKRFAGDDDWLQRAGTIDDITLFTNNKKAWFKIGSALQDIDLISKRLASKEYTEKALIELETVCDEASFKDLTSMIPL
jgi:hypothetical protein